MPTAEEVNSRIMLEQWEKQFQQTETIPSNLLINYLQIHNQEMESRLYRLVRQVRERLQVEQQNLQLDLEERLGGILQQVFLELQHLSGLLEKANNGELPPSNEIAELAGRILAFEKTVAGMRVRQMTS